MDDARATGVDIFTMGQYLQPSKKHLPVVEFVTPAKFDGSARLSRAKDFTRWFPVRFRAVPTTPSKLFQRDQSLSKPPGVGGSLFADHHDRRASRDSRDGHRSVPSSSSAGSYHYGGLRRREPASSRSAGHDAARTSRNTVQGLRYISSTSGQGVSTITCTFNLASTSTSLRRTFKTSSNRHSGNCRKRFSRSALPSARTPVRSSWASRCNRIRRSTTRCF